MAKFVGLVGFVKTVEADPENHPGVYSETYVERKYRGDILERTRSWRSQNNSSVDDLTISNRFSIVADAFATKNLGAMRYVKWQGVPWKIESVNVEPPRLVLSMGGIFNGIEEDGTSQETL